MISYISCSLFELEPRRTATRGHVLRGTFPGTGTVRQVAHDTSTAHTMVNSMNRGSAYIVLSLSTPGGGQDGLRPYFCSYIPLRLCVRP